MILRSRTEQGACTAMLIPSPFVPVPCLCHVERDGVTPQVANTQQVEPEEEWLMADAVHGSVEACHYGVDKTLNKLRQQFYWGGYRKDTELFVHMTLILRVLFTSGEKVWVDKQTRKKGVSPKLTMQWLGPCEVLEQLSDVVYRVKLCVRGRGWFCIKNAWHLTTPWLKDLQTNPARPAWLLQHL